jgi:hypothetical protein
MPSSIIIIRHSGLRQVDAPNVLAALGPGRQALPRSDHEIDTMQFRDSIEVGDWSGQAAYLRHFAAALHNAAEEATDAEVHYFGIAEIPHVLAFGAFFGDERHITIHEYNRDADSWNWPSNTRSLLATVVGAPIGQQVTSRGLAVLRVAISAEIADADVRAAVGDEALADVTIRLTDSSPQIAKVRSDADLQHIREKVREAIAAMHNLRPNIETLHLFVAAPVSVCLAVGQECKPRNFAPFQSYRYRNIPGQNRYQPAILVSDGIEEAIAKKLSDDEVGIAGWIRRDLWPRAIQQVENHARLVSQPAADVHLWYGLLYPSKILRQVSPFPALPGLASLPIGGTVDPNPKIGEYKYDKDRRAWELPDQLLASFGAISSEDDELLRVIRLFLFHEYVHDSQTVTAYTVGEIGKFANCLEYIDYVADSYALIHEFDLSHRQSKSDKEIERLATLIELLIKSFWAFETPGNTRWEVRRLRRYLNWYWRHVQIKEAASLQRCFQLLARSPKVELSGLKQIAQGRRVYCYLDKADPTTQLELGIVLENESLFRLTHSPNINIPELLAAFKESKHEVICDFFRSVYENARQTTGAQPNELPPIRLFQVLSSIWPWGKS